ncbi:MAG: hypothetical protein KBD27_01965 [Candidatus Moranbacteria bacterium]|nr:hypothetical protein [Candidatus Moranbacteria bacterium]
MKKRVDFLSSAWALALILLGAIIGILPGVKRSRAAEDQRLVERQIEYSGAPAGFQEPSPPKK